MELAVSEESFAFQGEIQSPAVLIKKLGAALQGWEARGKEALNRNPLQSLAALVLGGSVVYWAAEREKNEKVQSFWEALEYVSTCASVGYSNIFPATAMGRVVASLLFVLGPSLAAKALDHPSEGAHPGGAAIPPGQQAILTRLDEILFELRSLNGRR
jgi:voltage-gated potassium channel